MKESSTFTRKELLAALHHALFVWPEITTHLNTTELQPYAGWQWVIANNEVLLKSNTRLIRAIGKATYVDYCVTHTAPREKFKVEVVTDVAYDVFKGVPEDEADRLLNNVADSFSSENRVVLIKHLATVDDFIWPVNDAQAKPIMGWGAWGWDWYTIDGKNQLLLVHASDLNEDHRISVRDLSAWHDASINNTLPDIDNLEPFIMPVVNWVPGTKPVIGQQCGQGVIMHVGCKQICVDLGGDAGLAIVHLTQIKPVPDDAYCIASRFLHATNGLKGSVNDDKIGMLADALRGMESLGDLTLNNEHD